MKALFTLVLAVGALLAGCGGSDNKSTDSKNDQIPSSSGAGAKLDTTLRVNLSAEPLSLDPSMIDDIPGNKAMHGLMEPLVWLNGKMEPQPGVAESWEHDETFRTWTFRIRENARWHNGDSVTARDFKYAVERISTKTLAAPYSKMVYGFLEGGQAFFDGGGLDAKLSLDSVEVVDDRTLRYKLAFPAPFFLTLVAFAPWLPLHKPTIDAHGTRWAFSPDTYNGNGPFRMASYRARDHIELVRADTYWDKDAIFWEKVLLYMIDSQNTEDQAFRTGDLDVTGSVSIAQMNYWKERPEYRNVPSLGKYYISFNTTKAPFDNKLVRRAFSKAINRKLITERVTRGGETPSQGFVPVGVPSARGTEKDFRAVAGDFVGPQDIEAARKLLAEAGYGAGRPLPATEYLYNTSETHKVIAEQLQNMWRQAFDVDVRLQNADWGVVQDRVIQGDFMFCRGSWIADFDDPLNFLEIFQTGNAKNSSHFDNPEFNVLIEKARFETDAIKREDYFIQAEKLLVEDECAIAPLYNYNLNLLVQTDIEGLEISPIATMTYPRARRVAKR